MLLFVLHHLGDPLEVEFVKPASFANSFLTHVFGVPKWFLQITALQKPTPVHYSGVKPFLSFFLSFCFFFGSGSSSLILLFPNCSHSAKPPLSPPFHPHSLVSDCRSVQVGCP